MARTDWANGEEVDATALNTLGTDINGKAPSSHTHGVAGLTATGTRDNTTFLRGDNTWAVPPGGGGGGDSTRTGVFQFEHPNNAIAFGSAVQLNQRRLFILPHDASRFRLHIQNRNHLADTNATGTLSNLTAYIGEAKMDATSGDWVGETISAPVALTLSGTSLSAGNIVTSNWVAPASFPVTANKRCVISLGWSVGSTDQVCVGGGMQYYTFDRTTAGTASPAGLSRADNQGFLDLLLEYEFADDAAPVIMVVSNSLSGGGNVASVANRGDLDAWRQQWALAQRGVVGDLSVGGAWANDFAAASPKWSYYSRLATPLDIAAVVFAATSSSDIAGSGSSDETTIVNAAKSAMIAAVKKAETLWPNARIILTTNPPRIGSTAGAKDNARLTVNTWLASSPIGAEQCVDLEYFLTDGAVPARLHPLVDSGDHEHWSPRGHSRFAKQVPVHRS